MIENAIYIDALGTIRADIVSEEARTIVTLKSGNLHSVIAQGAFGKLSPFIELENLRYVNPEGAIMAQHTGTGREIYIDTGLLLDLARDGAYGEIAPFVEPDPKTHADLVAEWRETAKTDMMRLQDWIIDNQLWTKAEAISKASATSRKWRNRWDARNGEVRRNSEMLSGAVDLLLADLGVTDVTADEWLDALPVWDVPAPIDPET